MELSISVFSYQEGCIVNASWPVAGPVDEQLIQSSEYLTDAAHEFRLRMKTVMAPKKVNKCQQQLMSKQRVV